MSVDEFDLRTLVREVLRETDALGPEKVAAEVLNRLPDTEREAALVQGVTEVTRVTIARARVSPVAPADTNATEHPRPAGSRKVAGIQAYARALRNQVNVGDGRVRLLRDCTSEDLQYAAAMCERMAAANAHRAGQYRALDDLLRAQGVSTVGQLSGDSLGPALDDAA